LFLFVELVAERVARPLQAQRQAGLAIEDRSAGKAGKLLQHRLACAHGGAIAGRHGGQAGPPPGPAVIGANTTAEGVGVPDGARRRPLLEAVSSRAPPPR